MTDLAVRVENLGKRYLLAGGEFWAFRNVSFELRRGDVLGLVGHNGAGKSTLLKTLARITAPSEGYIGIKGRLAAMLEVGTGFNFELTGRENIYLNGSMLGMRKRELDRKVAAIIDFAEIGSFIDVAVKHYSSGMYIRLAFAIAVHVEPDVVLIDEVLGVGDMNFQAKCRARIRSMKDEGRTMVIVSHDLSAIRDLCASALLFDRGHVVTAGPTEQVLQQYSRHMAAREAAQPLAPPATRPGSGAIRATDFWIENIDGARADALSSGQDACFALQYATRDGAPVDGLRLTIAIGATAQPNALLISNNMMGHDFGPLAGSGQLRCVIPRFPLAAGTYRLRARLDLPSGPADQLDNLPPLNVDEGDFYGTGYAGQLERAAYFVEARWSGGPK